MLQKCLSSLGSQGKTRMMVALMKKHGWRWFLFADEAADAVPAVLDTVSQNQGTLCGEKLQFIMGVSARPMGLRPMGSSWFWQLHMQHTCSKDEFARNDGEAVEAMRPKVSLSFILHFQDQELLTKMWRTVSRPIWTFRRARSFWAWHGEWCWCRWRGSLLAPVKLAEEGEREKFCHVLGNVRIRNYLQRCEEQCPGLFGLSGDMDRLFGLCMHAD